MKRFSLLLLYGVAASTLLWFAGCSTDQAPTNPTDMSATPEPATEQAIDIYADQGTAAEEAFAMQPPVATTSAIFPTPSVNCVSSTDSTITVRVCFGAGGAPAGFAFQFYRVPTGTSCEAFTFPSSGVPTAIITGAYGYPAYSCVLITLRRVACETTYAFRARVLATASNGASEFSAKVCCSSLACGETNPPPTCYAAPTVQCVSSTDSTVTIRIIAGSTGTPGGIILQRTVLPGAAVCSTFAWPSTGVRSDTLTASVFRLPPFYSLRITLRTGIECGTTYAIRAKARATLAHCASVFSANTCCTTQSCEQGPPPGGCLDEPVVTCVISTMSSITLRVCAGASGAPGGIVLQYARLPLDANCATFQWSASTASVGDTPEVQTLDALACTNVTLYNVPCGAKFVFRARARATSTQCASDYTANVCCSSTSCP